jgi:hypothetical protein
MAETLQFRRRITIKYGLSNGRYIKKHTRKR